MAPEEQSFSQQALTALREAVAEVVEEARRTHGTVVVWEDGAVRHFWPINYHPRQQPSP